MISVVGGIYYEYCLHPHWHELFGSGARAACALAAAGVPVELFSYTDKNTEPITQNLAALEKFTLSSKSIESAGQFHYSHGLASPHILRPSKPSELWSITSDAVIAFGLLEGPTKITAKTIIYDPQNPVDGKWLDRCDLVSEQLIVILNKHEAMVATSAENISSAANIISSKLSATAVIIKDGPRGATLFKDTEVHHIPAHPTSSVWKIGCGDAFVAYFSLAFLVENLDYQSSANFASRATSLYSRIGGYPAKELLDSLSRNIENSQTLDFKSSIYLAGPFFNLNQLWLINEARKNLQDFGFEVFSPYHDVGLGGADEVVQKDLAGIRDCSMMFAVLDGLDSGTVYEIGYARALGKPVVIYSETVSEQDLKMMIGSGCFVFHDYVSAVYNSYWQANCL